MKQPKYAITVFLLCTAFACKKSPETIDEKASRQSKGQLTASLNGQPWESDVVSGLVEGNSQRINIRADVYVGGKQQSLSIDGIGLNSDKQVVYDPLKWISLDQGGYRNSKDTCFVTLHISAGDAGENSYGIIEDEDNFIQLEGYNGSPRIKGSFQFSLYRFEPDKHPQTQGLQDTLRFTNGKFNALLEE